MIENKKVRLSCTNTLSIATFSSFICMLHEKHLSVYLNNSHYPGSDKLWPMWAASSLLLSFNQPMMACRTYTANDL